MNEKFTIFGFGCPCENDSCCSSRTEWRGSQPGNDRQPRRFDPQVHPQAWLAEHLRACYEGRPDGLRTVLATDAVGSQVRCGGARRWFREARGSGKDRPADALKLARSHRSDDLTAVWVPDEGSEALRDLVRAREAAKQDQLRAKHRLTKFLLRTGQRPPLGVRAWTEKYVEWVQQVRYTHPAQEATLLDCLNEVQHMEERVSGWSSRLWK